MTPPEVRALSSWEYVAMLKQMDDDRREQQRQANKAKRR